jgi:hypothetical protein
VSRRTTRTPIERDAPKRGAAKRGPSGQPAAKQAPKAASGQVTVQPGTERARPRPPAARPRSAVAREPLASRFVEAVRRVPVTAWVCAAITVLNGACWSVISPPFQIPDEASHYAYVAHLAEMGSLPSSPGENFPSAETRALSDLHTGAVSERPTFHPPSSVAEQRQLEQDLALPGGLTGSGAAGVATSQPPLYYALEAVPYGLASGGTVLDRLQAMRLLSALFGGVAALFVYLFLREALPAEPWAWTVGGVGAAVAPLLGEMSGAVNPDALLAAVSAALFWCLARGFRRGLDRPLALAFAAVLAVGILAKLTFLALLPGAVLGLAVLGLRAARASRREAGRSLAIAASPLVVCGLLAIALGRSPLSYVADFANALTATRELSYVWQLYLPRLPGMSADFHGFATTRLYWFNDLVGDYGWLDTRFPGWVYTAALLPAAALAALLARAVWLARRAVPRRVVEAAVYGVIVLGLLYVIGGQDYVSHIPGEYVEPRYLLPLLALWGAALALAARGAGRRWGPVVGVAVVTLALAHDLFSQLIVVARYYG